MALTRMHENGIAFFGGSLVDTQCDGMDGAMCTAKYNGYGCTQSPEHNIGAHPTPHMASNGEVIVCIWNDNERTDR